MTSTSGVGGGRTLAQSRPALVSALSALLRFGGRPSRSSRVTARWQRVMSSSWRRVDRLVALPYSRDRPVGIDRWLSFAFLRRRMDALPGGSWSSR